MPRSRFLRSEGRAALLPAVLLALLLTACGGAAESPAADAPEPTSPPPRSYVVGGTIEGIIDQPGGKTELMIRHEAIPDFVDIHGEVRPMGAMTMGFPVAPEVSLEGVETGQQVRFTFRVDWAGSPAMELTSIEARPAGEEEESAEEDSADEG